MKRIINKLTLFALVSMVPPLSDVAAQTTEEAVKQAAEDRRRMMEQFRGRTRPQIVKPNTQAANAGKQAPASKATNPFQLPTLPSPGAVPALGAAPASSEPEDVKGEVEIIDQRLTGVSLEIVLNQIADMTGKIILRDPAVQDTPITLIFSDDGLPKDEYLRALDAQLAMNNIALVPFRDNYLKVVPANTASARGIPVEFEGDKPSEQDGFVSKVLQLKHLDYQEVQTLITERLSPNAKVQPVERNNSVLVTDSENNIRRVVEILEVIDQPADVREEVKIYTIRHATAADIKGRLEELIAESQEQLNRTRSRNNRTAANRASAQNLPNRPGVIRAPLGNNAAAASETGDAQQPGLVSGKVQIVADERTNILIIISRPENDKFFTEMIAALDRKVDPEIVIRNYQLEFAAAEDVASTLNELVSGVSQDSNGPSADNADNNSNNSRQGRSVSEFIRNRNAARTNNPVSTNAADREEGGIGDISEDTRILADERTNKLLLMGRPADLDLLEEVILDIDVMLPQVQIQAVIMEVNLSENFAYGIDWLQRSLQVNSVETVNGVPVRTQVSAFGGAAVLNGGGFIDGASVTRDTELPAGLSYFASLYDFNLDVIVRAAEGSSDAKVVARPMVFTTDNTEASIIVGERRAIPSTTSTTIGGSIQSTFEFENIGLDLKVTPRINPDGVVIMEIEQSAEDIGGTTVIDNNPIPNITTRQLSANVTVKSGSTIVLGGLVREDERDSVSRVPVLGHIPVLGNLFKSKSTESSRTELLVLISPTVLVTQEQAERATERIKAATELGRNDWGRGWTVAEDDEDAPMADAP